MTLLEIITQTAKDIEGFGNKENITVLDITKLFKTIDEISYDTLMKLDIDMDTKIDSILIKLLYDSAQIYGRQKWKEAIEVAKDSIVKDQSCAPEFVD